MAKNEKCRRVFPISTSLATVFLLSESAAFAWLTGFVFFACGFCYSIFMAFSPQFSCGCFGVVGNGIPWVSMATNTMIIIGLIALRPTKKAMSEATLLSRNWDYTSVLPCLVPPLLIGCLFGMLGPDLIDRIKKTEIELVDHDALELGIVEQGKTVVIDLPIRNNCSVPVKIEGGSSSCQCFLLHDLPLQIEPNTKSTIRVSFFVPKRLGAFRIPFQLYTDSVRQPSIFGYASGVSQNSSF